MTIKIDGSYGEGGGQIVRTALALSVATGKAVEIYNIRANRSPPGLKYQHLGVVRIFKKLSDAEVEGAHVGSTYLRFVPKKLRYMNLEVDLKTAASIPLVIQSLALLAPVIEKSITIKLIGGTDVKNSPTIDYMRYVFQRALESLGLEIEISLIRRGFYPKGGGVVSLVLRPSNLRRSFTFEPPRLRGSNLGLVSVATKDLRARNVASRVFNSALARLQKSGLVPNFTRVEYVEALSTGASVTVFIASTKGFIGSDGVGERGLPSEVLGSQVAERFLRELASGAAVDEHLADMVVPFGFFMDSLELRTSRLSKHLLTNLWVCAKFFEDHEYRVSEADASVRIQRRS